MIVPQKKEYEKPAAGFHNAILADVVEAGMQTTVYNGETKTFPNAYFVWILTTAGKDGKPLQVRRYYNVSSMHEKSNIYKDLKMILMQPPNPAADLDNYIGTVRKLWISREKSLDGTKDLVKISGYLPYEPGTPVPIIPPDFIRDKFKPKTQAGPQGQPVQTYQQPPQQQYQPVPAQAVAQYTPPAPSPAQAPQQAYQPAPPVQGADVKF